MHQYITCEVDGYGICIPISAVQEINRISRITPVQRAPRYIRGLLNLRGRVVTLIDLGVRLGMAESPKLERRENVVLKRSTDLVRLKHLETLGEEQSAEELQGFTVDRIGEVLEIPPENIVAVPPNIDADHAAFLNGVTRIDDATFGILRIGKAIQPDLDA